MDVKQENISGYKHHGLFPLQETGRFEQHWILYEADLELTPQGLGFVVVFIECPLGAELHMSRRKQLCE